MIYSVGIFILYAVCMITGLVIVQPLLVFEVLNIKEINKIGLVIGYLASTILILNLSKQSLKPILLNRRLLDVKYLLFLIVFSIASIILINELSAQFARIDFFEKSTQNSYLSLDIMSILLTLILAPICEELVFRGIIQKDIQNKYGHIIAILFTACLFSLSHFSIEKIPFTLMLGLLCGLIFYITESVLATILMHFMFNFIAVLAANLGVAKWMKPLEHSFLFKFNWYFILISLILFFITLKPFFKLRKFKK